MFLWVLQKRRPRSPEANHCILKPILDVLKQPTRDLLRKLGLLLPNLLPKASNPKRDSPFRERERERKKVGKQTAEWQQVSSAAIAQTISVRGTQDPSERLPQKVCEKRVQGLG
jgi:hypothetical protein